MPIAPLEKFGLGGLITDQPRESMDLTYFDDGLNMRANNGALTGVFDFDEDDLRVRLFQLNTDGAEYTSDIATIKPIEISQWTKAGTEYLDILTVGLDVSNAGSVYVTGGNEDPAVITACNLVYPFTYDQDYGLNSFIFNEVAILNTVTAPPMYSFDRENFYQLPNFFGEPVGSALTAVSQYTVYQITTVTTDDWTSIGGSGTAVVGEVFTATASSIDITALGDVKLMHLYTTKRMCVYNGRLIAMNLYNDLDTVSLTDDINSPIEVAWSTSVSSIGSIIGLEWYASFRNTAGNNFLTQTPGKVVDGKQLGEFLMIYKTDSVFRLQDAGDPLFLVGETAFLDDGILAADCVADIGSNRHFCVGQYGLYIHTGGPEKMDIAEDKNIVGLYDDLPSSLEDRALTFVFHDSLNSEVWTCYRHRDASVVATEKGCTRALVYNYVEDKFYRRSLPNVTKIIETEINGIVEIVAASADVIANSTVTGGLYVLSRTDLIADGWIQFTSRDLGMIESVKEINGMWPTAKGDFDMKVKASLSSAEVDMNVVTPVTFNAALDYKMDFRQLGRFHTIRVAMDGTTDPNISGMKVDMVKEGER